MLRKAKKGDGMKNNKWEMALFLILLGAVVARAAADPVLRRVRDIPAAAAAHFENGSLLLVSPMGQLRASVEKLLCNTPITHVGIVCIDAHGEPFLFHTRPGGAHLVPLHPWLRRKLDTNQVFVRRVVGGGAIQGAALETALAPLQGVQYSFGC
jgi:hypothetical protein